MDERGRTVLVAGATVLVFVLVQLGALSVLGPFLEADLQTVENPSDPSNSVLYFLGILVATGAMLLAIRYDLGWVIRGFVIVTSALLSWYVLVVLLPLPFPVPAVLAAGVGVALYVHPEWYVIDVAGVLMGAGAAGLFGITFGVLPALVLLTVLAVYDAISVYGTEHMLTLAEGAMELRMPVLFVIPATRGYSFLASAEPIADEGENGDEGSADGENDNGGENADEGSASEGSADGEDVSEGSADGPPADGSDPKARTPGDADEPSAVERGSGADDRGAGDVQDAGKREDATGGDLPGPFARGALFVGLGDAVVPTVMVTSAVSFADAPLLGGPVPVNLPGLGAAVGTLLGLCVLLWMVFRGRPHAGLPLLNGGAIAGYLAGSLYVGIPLVEALGLGPYV